MSTIQKLKRSLALSLLMAFGISMPSKAVDFGISITKNQSTNTVCRNGILVYTISVTNTGNGVFPPSTVIVTDTLPAVLQSPTGQATTGNWTFNNSNDFEATLRDALSPGASASFTITSTISSSATLGDTLSNTASVDAAKLASDTSEPVSATIGRGTLGVLKTGPATASAGGTIDYTITVNNIGSCPLTTIEVTDSLPGGAYL